MAENIKIGVDVDDNGSTKKVVKDAQDLRRAYDSVAASATAVKAAMAPKTTSALKGASMSTAEGAEFGVARAAVGTGAAGRDFAKQAQGLGGLVHVYATFAANLFAVGAAFRALSSAMESANMVKGLDQLGAASGKSLGTLSEQLVKATDGAVSLKDAMSAVALSSAGGMGNKQILEMAEVAKKASQALGISMPDAVSRLSRGITKLEPELLDELGILVRVDTATAKYAMSIGKTANSLSDLEKRQAFANEVLQQGKEKFSNIDIPANPYDKLLASMTNLANAGLGLVNNVLGPIVKVLSESPTALAGVFALIGTTLIKQALPALGAWRENLAKTAADSAANAKRVHDAFQIYSVEKDLAELDKKIGPIQQSINSKIAQAQTLLATTLSKKSKIVAQAMSGSVDSEALGKSVDTEIKRRTTLLDKTKELYKETDKGDASKLSAYRDIIAAEEKRIANLRITKDVLADAAKEQVKINEATSKVEEKKPKWFTGEGMRGLVAEHAQQKALSSAVLAQVGVDTATKGMGQAFKNLFENIKSGVPVFDELGEKIGHTGTGLRGLRAITTLVSGSFIIMGSAIGTALSAIAPYLELFALLSAAYSIFDGWASKATKQQEEFNNATQENTAAVKTAADTFDLYTTKKKQAFSVESVAAFSNALTQVTEALGNQLLAVYKFNQAANGWDKFKDSFASIWGGSNTQKLVASTIEDIQSLSNLLESSSRKSEQLGNIASKVLKIDPKDINNASVLEKVFSGMSETQKIAKIKELHRAFEEVAKQEAYSANATKAFTESLKEIDKISDQISLSNAFTDLQGKLGTELVTAANRFSMALMDPLKALSAIAEIAKNPQMLASLSETSFKQAAKAAEYVERINQANEAVNKSTIAAKDIESARATPGQSAAELIRARIEAKTAVSNSKNSLASLKKEAESFVKETGPKLLADIYSVAFEKIELGLKKAKELAQIGVERTQVGIYGQAGSGTAKREYDLKIRELNIQEELVKASYAQQLATQKNTDELTRLTAVQSVETGKRILESARTGGKVSETEKIAAENMVTSGTATLEMFAARSAIQSKASTQGFSPVAMEAARQSLGAYGLIEKQREAAVAGITGQKKSAGLELGAKLLDENLKKQNAINDAAILEQQTKLKTVDEASRQLGIYSNTLSESKRAADVEVLRLQALKEEDAINTQILKLAGSKNKEDIDRKTQLETDLKNLKLKNATDIANVNSKFESDRITGIESIKQRQEAAAKAVRQADLEIAAGKAQQQEAEISYRNALGLISNEEAARQRANIELQKVDNEYLAKSKDLETEKLAIQKSQDLLDQAKRNKEIPESELKIAQGIIDQETEALNRKKIALDTVNQAQRYSINATADMASTFMEMNNVVKGAFTSMADALVEFTRTGKLNFKSLVDSMLADLIRIQLRKQMEALFSVMQPGIGGFLKSMFGGPSAGSIPGVTNVPNMDAGITAMSTTAALGKAYEGGIQAFAKGGMFTNSLVTSPTLFKFAHGTGLMGEAGPEAIMPLKRDGQGNLGVRASNNSGQTSVVVNNYSSSQATTKETVDSRGNRKIEVVIGEMVAQEVGRTGSSMQQAMVSNFNTKPAVVRR